MKKPKPGGKEYVRYLLWKVLVEMNKVRPYDNSELEEHYKEIHDDLVLRLAQFDFYIIDGHKEIK